MEAAGQGWSPCRTEPSCARRVGILPAWPSCRRPPSKAGPGRGEGRRRSPRLRANGDSGRGSTLPRHDLDELSTGAKLKRPAGEGMGTGRVPIRTRQGWKSGVEGQDRPMIPQETPSGAVCIDYF